MKISESWLREYADPALDTAALVEQLTMAGLEVDGVEPVAGAFSGVVVGEVLSVDAHPQADKLRVCQVSDGADTVQVVCGAANVRAGLKVPFATVGAQLPGDMKISKAELRGVASAGMLCGADELGLAEERDGLMELAADAPVGQDLREYLTLDDSVIEIDLTPNRSDCLGVVGVARDIAVLNELPAPKSPVTVVAPQSEDAFPVVIEAGADCPRYCGRVIRGADVTAPTPLWMAERLRRSGVRSIDPIVDITNYVMLELGQPLHAFDLDTLSGGIVVRLAAEGEKITLLDGQELALKADALLIADHDRPLALAGVMGGENSGVSASSKDIFLESAFFAPEKIAGRARSYGLHTDASHRFERGVDPALAAQAIERATELILQISGGIPGPVVTTESAEDLPAPREVVLRRERIQQLLGMTLPDAQVVSILEGLGMQVTAVDGGWQAAVPGWRFDISIEADLLEELARVYGYNNLPVTSIHGAQEIIAAPETQGSLRYLRQQLLSRGYQEVVTYSFVDPALQRLIAPAGDPVALMNPIASDMSEMRLSLWPGLLATARHNLNRQQPRLRLFETGLRFVPSADGLQQQRMLALAITGRRDPEGWSESGEAVDYFDLKGDLEALLPAADWRFEAGGHPALHPGQSAKLLLGDAEVGRIGALHPVVQKKAGIEQPVILCEVELDYLLMKPLPAFEALGRFPEVRRDLAVIVDENVAVSELMQSLKSAAGPLLINLKLFDIYRGKGIDTQRKSVALGLTFQDKSRTLTDQDVNASIEAILASIEERYDAQLRA